MTYKKVFILFLSGCLLLSACGSNTSNSGTHTGQDAEPRPSDPVVLVPEASGEAVETEKNSVLDYSHMAEGYVMASHALGNGKFQLTTPTGNTYTYSLPDDSFQVFPLTEGDGTYECKIFRQVDGSKYALELAAEISLSLSNEFGPWLYPNQFVNFNASSQTVTKGVELAEGAYSDLEVISNIYEYITENITYDEEKARTVQDGYVPVVDEILASGTGICFDYASVMAAMLRSQNIPTRLEVGYAGSVYHAWISTHIDGKGWVNGIIEFDGVGWELMDPTFAASSTEEELKEFIGDSSNYQTKYLY